MNTQNNILTDEISSPEIKIAYPVEKKQLLLDEICTRAKKRFKKIITNIEHVSDAGEDYVKITLADGMITFKYTLKDHVLTIRFEAQDEETYLHSKKFIRRIIETDPAIICTGDSCINLNALN